MTVQILVICLLLGLASSAIGIQVTTNANSGPGSLREAITSANQNPDKDDITINIGVGAVSLLSPLPAILHPINLEGSVGVELRGEGVGMHLLSSATGNSTVLSCYII